MSLFKPATKTQSKLRMALIGPSGSGKTYTALNIAQHLGDRVAVIDTERGSASKYSGAGGFKFDVLELDSFSPQKYLEGINAAVAAGYDVLVIDSLSHAWMGKDGVLEFVDKAAARSRSNNSFGAWRDATPLHNSLVDGILDARIHIIATMRSKTEYVQEKDDRNKTVIRKVGMQPVQRDGLEYEFDVIADLDQDNNLIVGKTRCSALNGYVQKQAGEETAVILRDWLTDGVPAPEKPQPSAGRADPVYDQGPDMDEFNGEAADRGITAKQIQALAIAIGSADFGTDDEGKAKGRAFASFVAGRSEAVESIKDFTAAEAASVLDKLGGGDNGSYRTDPVKLASELNAWFEHLDFQRSSAALGKRRPHMEESDVDDAMSDMLTGASSEPTLPDFDPNTRPGKRSKKTMADPIEVDESADLREEIPTEEQQGALL